MNKPILVERYADNGVFSHWALIQEETGELLWSEAPEEETQEVKNCSIPDVGKRFSCTCAEPVPNYPEMLWCDCCGKPIEQKVRIKLDEGSASVQRYVSGETKHALNEMVKRVRKIFES